MQKRVQSLILIVVMIAAVALVLLRKKEEQKNSVATTVEMPIATPEPTPTPAPRPTVKPPKKTSAAPAPSEPTLHPQFQELRRAALQAIPTQAQLRAKTAEQVHFTPVEIQEAAYRLGQIAQAIHDDPSFLEEGLNFYQECAETDTFAESVRASCYANLQELAKENHRPLDEIEKDEKVSERVRRLAKKVQ